MTKNYSNKFNIAFDSLISLEGDYSNDIVDNGGETKYGISRRIYKNLDIKNITIDVAKSIYYRDYWLIHNYDAIENDQIAEKIFHTTVNTGYKQSHIILQRALRAVGFKSLNEDGILGCKTLAAINNASSISLIAALRSELAGFYRMLIIKNPSQNKFKNGWLNRAYR